MLSWGTTWKSELALLLKTLDSRSAKGAAAAPAMRVRRVGAWKCMVEVLQPITNGGLVIDGEDDEFKNNGPSE